MPSLKTRVAYQAQVLDTAQVALAAASTAVADATTELNQLAAGELDLAAVKIQGVSYVVNESGQMVPVI